MCGVFFWANTQGRVDPQLASLALLSLRHRGPNFQAIALWDGTKTVIECRIEALAIEGSKNSGPVYFASGHTRLSVIDLSDQGNQPMIGPSGEILSFNGVIYNYIELREQLSADGVSVVSKSDSEVLLKWLCHHGVNQNNALNGSWGFSFVDLKEGSVTLSRDPYGERPLYYYLDDENLIVASEIKAIYVALKGASRRFNSIRLAAFLAYQDWDNTNPSETIYADIRRVVPGTNIRFDLNTLVKNEVEMHSLRQKIEGAPDPESITDDLRKAVNIRLRADVPIGVFVSGGIDSTMIASLIEERRGPNKDITFYTAKFPDGVSSDYPFAEKVAADLGIALRTVEIPFNEQALLHYSNLSHHYDQPVPFAGSTISENILLKAMADDGIRVAISGTGGDEVFGGYGNEYIEGAMHDMLSRGNPLKTYFFARQVIKAGLTSFPALALFAVNRMRGNRRNNSPYRNLLPFVRNEYRDLFEEIARSYWGRNAFHSPMREVQLADCLEGRLANYVVYSDTNSMMHSIENRSPFLDPTLTKYMALDPTQKYQGGYNKFALRRAMPPTIDSRVTWRKQKQGFTFPFDKLYEENKQIIHSRVANSVILNEMIDVEPVLGALKGHSIERSLI